MFKIFEKYPNVASGFSTKKDGSMRLFSDEKLFRPNRNNRKAYFSKLGITLNQLVSAELIHGSNVEIVDKNKAGKTITKTDALITQEKNLFLTITAADCFPVYIFDPISSTVALAHVGWRGAIANIISMVIMSLKDNLNIETSNVLVGIGPGIRSCHFEIKKENQSLYRNYPEVISEREGSVYVDLRAIILKQFKDGGIDGDNIETSEQCTHCLSKRYFSYRREQPKIIETMIAYIGVRFN